MTVFSLKLLALFSMICDHLGYIIFDKVSFLNMIGRLAFPIYAFLLTEGYIHTKNLKRYLLRLFIFALISQIPFMLYINLFNNNFTLNIFFTLFLGLLSITIFNKSQNKILGFLCSIVIIVISQLIHCDYGWFGVSIILLFYLFKNNKLYMNTSIMFLIFTFYLIKYFKQPNILYIYLLISTLFSLIFINLYSGKKGKNIKYFLYLFYPLHLLILYFAKIFI